MTTELFSERTTNYAIGLILAISSCFFIGSSFIIKKKALIKAGQTGQRASKGGHGYLKEFQWWCGLISMAVGEAMNFAAYAFAPASLITPLGALSILVTAVLASHYLNEKLSLISKLGCILCITGSISIVLHAPKEGEIDSLRTLGTMIMSVAFLNYMIFIVIVSSVLVYYSPTYGEKTVVVYVLICSLVGSLSVMACKGIGIAIAETANGIENNFRNPLFYFLLIQLGLTVTVQMNYLNKALDTFDTFVVTPVYYVFFTTFVLIASAILFQEWKNLEFGDVLGTISGFVNVIVAIFMLNAFKNHDANLEEIISHISRPKYESLSSSEPAPDTISLKS